MKTSLSAVHQLFDSRAFFSQRPWCLEAIIYRWLKAAMTTSAVIMRKRCFYRPDAIEKWCLTLIV